VSRPAGIEQLCVDRFTLQLKQEINVKTNKQKNCKYHTSNNIILLQRVLGIAHRGQQIFVTFESL